MNEDHLTQYFNQLTSEISPLTVSINLIIGFILSKIIAFHYKKYSSVLSCKKSFGNVIPFITLVTILVITVVKSSLALSLGLVGALSIVRFRTPIKEPEELAYLFLSIGIGLGLGANMPILTIISFVIILVLLSIAKEKSSSSNSFMLHVENFGDNDNLEEFTNHLKSFSFSLDIRRIDKNISTNLVYIIHLQSLSEIVSLKSFMSEKYPNLHYSIIDQSDIPIS
jgi:hypothetical protein